MVQVLSGEYVLLILVSTLGTYHSQRGKEGTDFDKGNQGLKDLFGPIGK